MDKCPGGHRARRETQGWQTPKLPEVRHFLLAGITAVVPQGARQSASEWRMAEVCDIFLPRVLTFPVRMRI